MSRARILYDSLGKLAEYCDDELIWLRDGAATGNKVSIFGPGPGIMRDIEPYKSMITGETITSRSRHRDHLRQHNCVEVGNDTSHLANKRDRLKPKVSVRETLQRQLADVSDKDARKIIKNELKARRH